MKLLHQLTNLYGNEYLRPIFVKLKESKFPSKSGEFVQVLPGLRKIQRPKELRLGILI